MLWLNQFHPMAVPVTQSISQKWKRYFSAKKSIGTRFSAKSWRETVSWSSLGADGLCQPTGSTTNRPTIRNSCANFFWHKCKCKNKQVQRHAKTKIKTTNKRHTKTCKYIWPTSCSWPTEVRPVARMVDAVNFMLHLLLSPFESLYML